MNEDVYKENYLLKKQIVKMRKSLDEVGSILWCIGGPLNDSISTYTKKQLKPFFDIEYIVAEWETNNGG